MGWLTIRFWFVAVVYHTDVVAKTLSHRPFCPYHRFCLLDLFARTVLMFCHQDIVLDQIRQSSDYAILIGDWTEVTVLPFQWTIFQSHALYTDNDSSSMYHVSFPSLSNVLNKVELVVIFHIYLLVFFFQISHFIRSLSRKFTYYSLFFPKRELN